MQNVAALQDISTKLCCETCKIWDSLEIYLKQYGKEYFTGKNDLYL